MTKKLLVTSALPYANGDIHLGHLVETIQTDIWVRFQKLKGNHCIYMCADDTHGTPIMISAKKLGISPEKMVEDIGKRHQADFARYGIEFDHYGSTNSDENRRLSEDLYLKAVAQGVIAEREISQMYCPNDQMFLPDRLIRGRCPRCQAEDQYGDSCEKCAATYAPSELIDSRCAECGATPVTRNSVHHFFKLSQFKDQIEAWVRGGHVQTEVANKLAEWFESGLRDWDISRDAPYFGFKIPGTDDKYFYVWLDAPIGYIATTQQWADAQGGDWRSYWQGDAEIHHFIGKDILYFHTLFWPALLMVGGYQLPTNVHVHGFLTVNGEKMSKSRGTFINASEFAEAFNPEFLRYYFASKLSPSIDDIDLNFEDFVFKVNAEVVNKIVNIASRLGAIVHKSCGGVLSTPDPIGGGLLNEVEAAGERIGMLFEALEYHKATREIMGLADRVNQYIDTQAPWSVAKTDPDTARQICTSGLNALRLFAIYLKPILPQLVAGVEAFLGIEPLYWSDLNTRITQCPINPYTHLAQRVDMAAVKVFLGER
jgi:methionyl-tRNA synthetase